MDVQQLLARFDAGVRYACGCEERGLHPAVVRGVMSGAIPTKTLTRCPLHAAPLVEEQTQVVAASAAT